VKRIFVASLVLVHKRMCLITFGALILFDVVATFGGGAFATLGLGAVTL